MSLVAGGNTVYAVVAEAARFHPWPTTAYPPIRGAPLCHWPWSGAPPATARHPRPAPTAADETPQSPAPTG
ncbi:MULTISPECIES: hypothetical protein [unclassified Streptomyces]|uniref:hypothetical protein n=1 Tax=unclassified Streptomyces TaxID=2593676 RepID=UPI00225C07E4|nr:MULTISPECIES: hypothetical protein [unclassified Streptomyces]MCX4885322.1 hypothetical protein [Streptomyces sp. NBC_00847]MCX5425186.1 hypothetical protein [Streptomyces sp. NBC_00078]